MSNNPMTSLFELKPLIAAIHRQHPLALGAGLRQMLLIPLLVEYYQSKYAEFNVIDNNEIQRLQIACLFMNIEQSDEEKRLQQAAEYFKAYVSTHLAALFSAEQREKYEIFIRYQGRQQRHGVEAEILNYTAGFEKLRFLAPWKLDGIKHFHLKHLGLSKGEALFKFYDELLSATGENPIHQDLGAAPCDTHILTQQAVQEKCRTEIDFCLTQLSQIKMPPLAGDFVLPAEKGQDAFTLMRDQVKREERALIEEVLGLERLIKEKGLHKLQALLEKKRAQLTQIIPSLQEQIQRARSSIDIVSIAEKLKSLRYN